MSLDSLGQLEARIQETHDLNPQQKEELLGLLANLKEAVAKLSTTHEAHAHSRTSMIDSAGHETTNAEPSQHPLRMAMENLSTSVEAFEASHPELVNTVNKISMLLANMGI
jgi:seryl-tRNA synthetase